MENEEWRDVPGWEGYYQVSSLGRVKSNGRFIRRKNGKLLFKKESIGIGWTLTNGYVAVSLSGVGKKKTILMHQLVAMAFLDHQPCGFKKVLNHKNFRRNDNRVENLEIVSVRENNIHKNLPAKRFTGVYSDKDNGRFRARIHVNGNMVHLGTFSSEEEAHSAYCDALRKINNNKIVNENKIPQSSKFKWVHFRKDTKKWVARIYINGKHKIIGNFKTEKEAAAAVEKAIKKS